MGERREIYAKPGETEALAARWLEEIRAGGGRFPDVPKGRAALLLVDLQRFFLSVDGRGRIPSAEAFRPNWRKLVELCKTWGWPVAHTRHRHPKDEDGFPFTAFWRGRIMEDDPFSELDAELAVPDAPVFDKRVYSAFSNPDLLAWLRENEIKTVLFAGVTAHLCVETSARDAFGMGFFPLVAADAVAAWTARQHFRLLEGMADGFGRVTCLKELPELFANREGESDMGGAPSRGEGNQ